MNSDERLAKHAAGALLLLHDRAADVLPILAPLIERGRDECTWVAEAVGALVEAREQVTIEAIWETLATVPIEGYGELTRGYYLQWMDKQHDSGLVSMMRDVPQELIDDVLGMIGKTQQTEVTNGNRVVGEVPQGTRAIEREKSRGGNGADDVAWHPRRAEKSRVPHATR